MPSNYGYGLNDWSPNTPWNEPYIPEKDFEITCSQSLSRIATVTTTDYNPVVEDEPWNGIHEEYADTSDTCWSKEYSECGYTTPLELIGMLKEYLQKDLEKWKIEDEKTPHAGPAFHVRRLKHLIEECDCWTEDETEFSE